MSFPPEKIRNVALVGHGGSGKTTLAEALLHIAGATTRLGRVEDGTTVCDHDPEEQARGFSLSLAVAPFEWKGHKVNLIDTPGYADFTGDLRTLLPARPPSSTRRNASRSLATTVAPAASASVRIIPNDEVLVFRDGVPLVLEPLTDFHLGN